jgi:hypothetical protein
VNFWSDALGGDVRLEGLCGETETDHDGNWVQDPDTFRWSCASPSYDDAVAIVFKRTTVEPGSTEATAIDDVKLACFFDCPDPDKVGDSADSWSDQYEGEDTERNYYFDATDMVLKEFGTNKELAYPSDGKGWGLWTGALFEGTPANLAKLACPWDAGETCGWRAEEELDVFYRWESGKESWNKLVVVQDAEGNPVTFDKPFSVTYEHTGGTKYRLEYGGFGDLWGLPFHCENGETGEEIPCQSWGFDEFEDVWIRWVEDVNIPAGTNVTYAHPTTGLDTEAVVKAQEEEHFLNVVDSINCTNAGITTTDYTADLPSLDDWVDSSGIGELPTGDIEIKVIEGVYQTE